MLFGNQNSGQLMAVATKTYLLDEQCASESYGYTDISIQCQGVENLPKFTIV